MALHRIGEQPLSRLAVWARRIAFFSFIAAILAIIVVRSSLLEIEPALATFGGALAFAVFAILLALLALAMIWKDGTRGIGHVFTAIFLGAVLLAYPAYLGIKAYRLPVISDITTDPIDPPRFEAIARLRSREANPVVYAGLYAAEQQRAAYPEVEPLTVAVSSKLAFETTIAIITKRKWRVVDAREPVPGRREGHIEAVARTPIMGFRDDVAIRVDGDADEARIDVRSSSRYGRHDFGANASRIVKLLEDIDAAVDKLAQEKDSKDKKDPKKDNKKDNKKVSKKEPKKPQPKQPPKKPGQPTARR